ncbi:MAG TPA: transglycosylase SLT domain-containing protein [Acidimicrobiales bacterium]|nr:transglycosylase SLT domain-containing protein [Acidimicrobiales bacterium]
MTYVSGLSSTLAEITQIQSELNSFPAAALPSGFEAVMEQVSALSGGAGVPGLTSPEAGDASGADIGAGGTTVTDAASGASLGAAGSYGWPLEEGAPLPTGAEDAMLGGGVTVEPTVAGAGDATGYAPSGTAWPVREASVFEPVGSNGATSLDQAAYGTPGTLTGAALGEAAVTTAEQYLGVPYLWGGTDPAQGLDCSGLVQDVYGQLGVNLPRTSQEQALVGQPVPSLADAQPGDLVFFPGSDGTATAPGHVGIYIGNGEMIDAPHAGSVVQVGPVGDPTAIRRVTGLVPSSPATVPSPWSPLPSSASAYAPEMASAASTYGVPVQLLAAVASTESSFQPDAVSSAGAQGLMQLMPGTASSLGVDPFDPSQAIVGAAQLLSSYHARYGSWALALAAYNAGPNAVDEFGGIPPYGETQAYVQTVLARSGLEEQ